MARKVIPLTEIQIKNAKAADKEYKMFDGHGLYLLVKTDGSKHWRYKYRFAGVDKLTSLGKYPQVSLLQARQKHLELKTKIADGINPAEEKIKSKQALKEQVVKDTNTLSKVFTEWLETKKSRRSESTNEKAFNSYEKNIKPWLGNKTIKEITKTEIIECLKRVDKRTGGESSKRLKSMLGQIWSYALTFDLVEKNIVAEIDSSIVLKQAIKKEMAHLTDEEEFAGLIRDIEKYKGHFITICALKIASLLFVRPLNIRLMEWVEIDFDKKIWTIPPQRTDDKKEQRQGNRMKKDRPHIVPLPTKL
jgi:integrase